MKNIRFKDIVLGLLFLGLLVYIGIVIYAMDKGFQFSDAGFYVMRYQDYQPLGLGIGCEHLIMRTIFSFVPKDIVSLRWFEVALALLSSLVLAFAFLQFSKTKYKINNCILILIVLTIFSSVLFHLSTGLCVSYNSLNLYSLILAVAFLFLAITHKSIWYSLMIGLFLSFVFYIKISTFFLVLPLFLLASIFVHEDGEKIKHSVAIFSAVIGVLLVSCLNKDYFAVFMVYVDTIKGLYSGGEGGVPSSHGAHFLVRNAIVYSNEVLLHVIRGIFIYMCILIIKQVKPVAMKVIFSLFLITLAGCWTRTNLGLRITNVAPFISGFVVILLNSFFTLSEGKIYVSEDIGKFIKDNKQLLWLVVLLLLLPTVNSFGTNGVLLDHTKRAIIFYMLAMLLLYISIRSVFTLRVIYILTSFIIIFSSLGLIYHPRCRHKLFHHKFEYKGIKYDKESYEFLTSMEKALRKSGFNTDNGMATLYLSPGLVYLLGSYYPTGVFFSGDAADKFFEYLLKTKQDSLPLPAIIVNNVSASDALKEQFTDVGITFDKEYKCIYSHYLKSHPRYKYSLYVPVNNYK